MENQDLLAKVCKAAEMAGEQIRLGFAAVERHIREYVELMRKAYEENKEQIDAEADAKFKEYQLEQNRLMASMPKILVGDIVRIKSVHMAKLKCYEVDSIELDGVVSEPAGFHHRYNEIIAVYRFDGTDFKCIWEREDYKDVKNDNQ